MTELHFGECERCFDSVERVGWDRYCFNCQDDMRLEAEEEAERLREEDHFLYSVPVSRSPWANVS